VLMILLEWERARSCHSRRLAESVGQLDSIEGQVVGGLLLGGCQGKSKELIGDGLIVAVFLMLETLLERDWMVRSRCVVWSV